MSRGLCIALINAPLLGALNQQPPGGAGMAALPGPQPDELRDILPPVEVPYWTGGKLFGAGVAGVILLGILVWGGVLLFRTKKPGQPPPSPGDIAIAGLERLRSEFGMALSSRDFAAEVGVVLRRYLEAIYGIQVTRQTTEEFLKALEADLKFGQLERDQLRGFLVRCDQFKFAGEAVDRDVRVELIEVVEERVKKGAE